MVGNEAEQPRVALRQQVTLSWFRWVLEQVFLHNSLVSYHLLPLLGYLLLTILYTWPAAPTFFTHIPGIGDAPWFLWQFWWFKHALLDLQQSPYVTNLIYYPLTDVPVMAQTPVNELFSLPIQVAFHVVILNNLLFFGTYLLSGYFTYLLGVALTRRRLLAFVGGMIFAFCTYRGIRSLGHMSLLTTQWMPLALLLIIQCGRRPSWQRGVAAGVAAGLVALSSPYYIGLFLFPVALAGALDLLLWERPQLRQKRLWQVVLMGGFTFLAVTIPPYLHYTQLEPEVYDVMQALQSTTTLYSADLLSWWLPSAWHPLWRTYTEPIYNSFTTPNITETTLFVGYIPLLLLLLSFGLKVKPATLRFWQMLAVGSWLLSLGPVLHFHGKPLFAWMPYRFLELLPGFSNFRAPSRMGITTALALSVIAMLVVSNLMTRYRHLPWSAILGTGALLIFANNLVMLPFRQTDIRIPAIYETVATASGRGAVLELPAGEYFHQGYNYFEEIGQAMYYQSYHHKPIVSGYLGRRPKRLNEPEQTQPFVRHFFQDHAQPPQAGFATRALLPEPFRPAEWEQAPWLLQHQGIDYVVLRVPFLRRRFFMEAAPLLNQGLGLPVQIDGDFRLYKVAPPPYHLYQAPLSPLVAPMPAYNAAFAPMFRDKNGTATRTVVLNEKSPIGEIRFTLPVTGIWSLQGEWVGAAANAVQVALNGAPLALRHDAYDQIAVAWATTITGAPGEQLLTLSLPPTAQATSDGPCATLCLRDFAVRLVQPTLPAAPLATFVNASNQKAALLDVTLLTTAETTAPVLQTAWLATLWRLDEATFAQIQNDPQALPTLYMHLTTTDGQKQAQVDHRLGERRLVLANAPVLFDLIPLPVAQSDLAALELRLGLWYPETNAYFWATESSHVDGDNRFNLGRLIDYRQSVAAPAIAINKQLQTTFALPEAAEHYTLLQARILTATNPTEPPTLLTTWRTPYYSAEDQIELRLLITNAEGAPIDEVKHRLGVDNLLNLATPYMIDRTTLPALPQPATDLFFWVDLIQMQTNQPLSIVATARPTPEERVHLGAWHELVMPPTP